ncbi:hypothetical protein [Pedobacter sp. KLB.chiD]|uniref:hypothetical protein n=1 Tax=Pedobacter sp. KLB.chiD TaxID=3387402 RepID=UPI00399A9B69
MKKRFLTYSICLGLLGIGMNRAQAQQTLKIGTNPTTVNNSAVLDVEAANKGVLLPRVALTGLTDVTTVPSAANALTVFNTATAGTSPNNVIPGYYYWNAGAATWVRLNDQIYYNGLSLKTGNRVGLGGQFDEDTRIYYNDKSMVFLYGDEGNGFPGAKSIGFSKGGLRLRYNDGGSGDASGTDTYLSIQNSRTVDPQNLQLNTSYDGYMTGIKSILGSSNSNGEKLIGGQFGVLNKQTSGANQEQVGLIAKSAYMGNNNSQVTKTIGGFFESKNVSAANTGNYAIYSKATGINPIALLADSGVVIINDLNSTATATTGNRPVVADANGQLKIGTASAAGWSLTGNAGTNSAVNFLGTTDNQDLLFKRNNVLLGRLYVNSLAFGISSLPASSIGSYNNAFGSNTLTRNTTGSANTALGWTSFPNNTTGSANVGVGWRTGEANTTGNQNIAVGNEALNINETGSFNIAIGNAATSTSTSSSFNIMIGSGANVDTEGGSNLALGTGANVSGTNLTNASAIGTGAQVTASNSLVLGQVANSSANIPVTKVGIGVTAPNSTLQINGSVSASIITVNASYSVTDNDFTIIIKRIDSSPISITLPNATANKGRIYVLRYFSMGFSGYPTVNARGDFTSGVSGATTTVGTTGASNLSNALTVQSDGTEWLVIGS